MRYLNPKADLTFKKVFGEHEDITISFLNAMLPFEKGKEIVSIEFMNPELVPNNPGKKDSIVDVYCKDAAGRQFIVEMQVHWTPAFQQRVLFNASKAYVRQLDSGQRWEMLQPVYVLSLLDTVFAPDLKEFFHPYHIVHEMYSDRVIEGFHLYFVELPKFTPQTHTEKKITALWLRFLTEINEGTRKAPDELMEDAEVRKAVELVEESAYTEGQMLAYDQFWDAVSNERSWIGWMDDTKKELESSREKLQQKEEELQQVRQQISDIQLDNARKMKDGGIPVGVISNITGIAVEEIEKM